MKNKLKNLKDFLSVVLTPSQYNQLKHSCLIFSQSICRRSIKAAIREQGLSHLFHRLTKIVPDIEDQYSTFKLDTRYMVEKVRAQHAFQILLVQKAIKLLGADKKDNLKIVDIGDSAGTHIQYINNMFSYKKVQCISVNLDAVAVKKIQEKGLDAVCARAEELTESHSIDADIFLSFEMLEHLMNPVGFLYSLSMKTNCKFFIMTVPYLKSSRTGLHYIRNLNKDNKDTVTAESTHIFELSPEDWSLLFRFTGWRVVFRKIYYQYPRRHWLRITYPYWKVFDFEGFFGAILARDHTWCNLYNNW